MNEQQRHYKAILLATDEVTKFWGLHPAPAGFACTYVCGWHAAVTAVMEHSFDVVVATYPLGDKPFRLFIHAVRSNNSRCQAAGLVVITTSDQKKEAAAFIGRGVNRVISVEEGGGLHHAITEVIDVSPRAAARLMVNLQMPLGEREGRIRTFTENISRSGMLLGTSNRLEIGQVFDFEFGVPDSDETVVGRAEVVRHRVDEGDQASGIGIRFLDLEDASDRALQGFLEKVLSSDDLEDS